MTVADFHREMLQRRSQGASRFVYYTGHLSYDSMIGEAQEACRALSKAAWQAYLNGKGVIVHRRLQHKTVGLNPIWEYIFVLT